MFSIYYWILRSSRGTTTAGICVVSLIVIPEFASANIRDPLLIDLVASFGIDPGYFALKNSARSGMTMEVETVADWHDNN